MSDVFSGAPENCDAAAERRRPKRTQKAEGDTMAVGRIGDNVITLGGIFPSLLWMEGRKGSCATTSESDSSWRRRCRPDSSPEIEIATFPPSLSLLFSSTSGPKNYRTSFSLRRAIRAEVSCLTFVLLPSFFARRRKLRASSRRETAEGSRKGNYNRSWRSLSKIQRQLADEMLSETNLV